MYGENKTSNSSRYILLLIHLSIIFIAWRIYFNGGIELIGAIFNIKIVQGNFFRLVILFSFSLIYFFRVLFTLLSFLKRRIDWNEIGAITFGLVLYHIGFALTGATQTAPIDIYDIIPICLYALGSYLNTVSEYQRKKFKEKEENKGKLYTEGLFKYSQHINYFGDFVWILGFALMTRNIFALILPLLCFLGFIFINIPMLDKYLEEKYKSEFIEWNKTTKKFIPFIY